MLISPNFLASEFIAEHELPRILKAADRGTLRVLPLYISSSNVGVMQDLSGFQGINDPQQPLASLPEAEQDMALVDASKAIINALGIAPWKQKNFLLQRVLPIVLVLGLIAAIGLFFLREDIEERSTRALIIIPSPQVRTVLPEVNGVVTNPRTLVVDIPGSEVSVDTMFQRIYVLGGKPVVLERIFENNKEEWQGVVRAFLVNNGNVPEDRLDFAVEWIASQEPMFLGSPKVKAGDSVNITLLDEDQGETRIEINKTITIQDGSVTTLLLFFEK